MAFAVGGRILLLVHVILALIFSYHHNGHVRAFRGARRFGEPARIVAQHSTAFHRDNPGLPAGCGFDTFQNTDDVL